jgi:hypothetical protein
MMTLDESIDYVASKFIYKNDPLILTDAWFVMRNKENGFYYGDCEDFALTVFWCMCGGSILMFIKNILNGTYKLHMVASNDNKNNHCVAEFKDLWFDNWTRKELLKDEFFKLTNHKYGYQIKPFTIMCKLIIGLFYR